MIAVGAAFKFFSGQDVRRAPEWMVRHHLEFLHRIFSEPKKQIEKVRVDTAHASGPAMAGIQT